MSVGLSHTLAAARHTRPPVDRRIGMVMAFVAATLAVGSFIHLAGYTPGGTKPPFDASHAGIAEAIIGAVIAAAAIAVLRAARRARTAAVVTPNFAIVGFLVGLNITVRGGEIADAVYHLVTLSCTHRHPGPPCPRTARPGR